MLIRMHSCFAWTEEERERAWSSRHWRAPRLYLSFEILHKTKIIWMLRLCFLLCQLFARVVRERVRGSKWTRWSAIWNTRLVACTFTFCMTRILELAAKIKASLNAIKQRKLNSSIYIFGVADQMLEVSAVPSRTPLWLRHCTHTHKLKPKTYALSLCLYYENW